jgi:hypothetical protein
MAERAGALAERAETLGEAYPAEAAPRVSSGA